MPGSRGLSEFIQASLPSASTSWLRPDDHAHDWCRPEGERDAYRPRRWTGAGNQSVQSVSLLRPLELDVPGNYSMSFRRPRYEDRLVRTVRTM